MEMPSTATPKAVPMNANVPDLPNLLASDGGNVLVLRDMSSSSELPVINNQ